MLKYFLIFTIALFPYIATAQNASADSTGGKSCFIKPMPFIIKTAPVAPFYKNRMFTLGIEVPLCGNFSAGFEAGYIFGTSEKLEKINTSKLNYDLRLDGKYYFKRTANNLRVYTGPLVNYMQMNTEKGVMKWYKDVDENGREVDMFSADMVNTTAVKRETVNILWQAGIQPILCSRITFNLFTALGVGMDFDKRTSREGIVSRDKKTYLGSLTGAHIGFAF